MQEAETRTSSELGDEQVEGTQDAQISEDTVESQVSESFDGTLEGINRDDLSPEMQLAYDDLLERASNMNKRFTQTSQEVSSVRKDAENWRTAMNHPVIGERLSDMVAKARTGQPIEAPAPAQMPTPTEQTIDPEQDPMGAFVQRISGVIDEKIQAAINPLQQGMDRVSGYVSSTQAQSEFQELAREFPMVEAVGPDAINALRSRYSTPGGPKISLKHAVGMYAVEHDPSILSPRPPASQSRQTSTTTRVEPPTTSTGGKEATPMPASITNLLEKVTAKDFKPSLLDDTKRGLAKFFQRGGA